MNEKNIEKNKIKNTSFSFKNELKNKKKIENNNNNNKKNNQKP